MAATTTSEDERPPPLIPSYYASPLESRLSLPFPVRLPLCIAISSMTGGVLGGATGSVESGYRFRAENAHRLPKTQAGWYLYHKSKNYVKMMGALKQGLHMAGRLSTWTLLFVSMEEAVDGARAGILRLQHPNDEDLHVSKDFISTALAGLGTAGAFSAWNRFPIPTAARLARLGLKVGIAYGLVQDAMSLMRGRRLGYVEFVKRNVLGSVQESHSTAGFAG